MTEISEEKEKKLWRNCGGVVDLDKLKEKWPSPFVSRDRIGEFTQGMFKPSSLNTLDARGNGITPRYCRGSKIFYETDDVVAWLKTKIKTENGEENV